MGTCCLLFQRGLLKSDIEVYQAFGEFLQVKPQLAGAPSPENPHEPSSGQMRSGKLLPPKKNTCSCLHMGNDMAPTQHLAPYLITGTQRTSQGHQDHRCTSYRGWEQGPKDAPATATYPKNHGHQGFPSTQGTLRMDIPP